MTSLFCIQRSAQTFKHLRPAQCSQRSIFNVPNISSLSPFNAAYDPPEQSFHQRKILPYSQKQLYDVVADVASYHRFVPYCTASRVLKSSTLDDSVAGQSAGEKKQAELTVGFLGFKESYVSEVTCNPYLSVEAVASSSTPLFKKLSTTWRFQPAGNTSPHPTADPAHPVNPTKHSEETDGPTLLSIDLVYAFSNPLHAGISAAFFQQVSKVMVTAFEERCLEVYGPGVK